MTNWIKQSIKLAESHGYLDKLTKVYPAATRSPRPLDVSSRETVARLYDTEEDAAFLEALFKITKSGHPFPIEHPYASLLRQEPSLVELNPSVVHEIASAVRSLPMTDVIKGLERPIDINRAMGEMFHTWLSRYFRGRGIPFLAVTGLSTTRGPAFLNGRDADIQHYANRQLGLDMAEGRDFLYRINDTYVIGEARFLSTTGGSQTRDLGETIKFVRSHKGKVMGVGVVDGIVWFNSSYKRRLEDLNEDEPVLSALLLDDFLAALA